MKALITGASGFIGGHLARHLVRQGDEVTGLVRRTSRLDGLHTLGVRPVFGDVRDLASLAAAVADVDVVYHLAGLTKALRAKDMMAVNTDGARNIAAACAARTTPPVLVVVSSLAAAGPACGGRLRTESDPMAPVSTYGRSKLAGEQAARQQSGRLPITIVRPPIVLGADENLLVFARGIARFGMYVVPSWTDRPVSVIHADDLAIGLRLAAVAGDRLRPGGDGADLAAGTYFVADNVHPPFGDLGRRMGQALKRERVRVVYMPEWLGWLLAGSVKALSLITRKPQLFNPDKMRDVVAGEWTCSPARAERDLGFHVGASLDERLKQVAEWCFEHGAL